MARAFDELQSMREEPLTDQGVLIRDPSGRRLWIPRQEEPSPAVSPRRDPTYPFDVGKADQYRSNFRERFYFPGGGDLIPQITPGTKSWPRGLPITEAPVRVAQAGAGQTSTDAGSAAAPALPPGFRYEEQGLPPGFHYEDQGKVERFIQNVTPEGPISGAIALARTARQAILGQRPDLMTNPEEAIPEAVMGAVAPTGARALVRPGRVAAPPAPEPAPAAAPVQPRPGITPDESRFLSAAKLATERAKAEAVSAKMGEVPPYVPEGYVEPPPPSNLLPTQMVREFGAVRRGVELREKLNPESATNVGERESARAAALQKAAQPHLNAIGKIANRSPEVASAINSILPEETMLAALRDPVKAASLSAWAGVYERAARAGFTPQARASLGLATRNLNNNLGTDLSLADILKGP